MADTQTAPDNTSASADVITKQEAARLAQEAAQAALDEFKKNNPGLTQEEVQAQILEDRKTLASLILGQTDKKDKDPVRELLESDPTAALALFGDALREDITRRVVSEIETEKQKNLEQKQAVVEVLKDRPDITTSEQQLALLNTFYKATDAALPEKERVKEALRQTDLLLEQQGLGDRESRVKKFTTVKSSSSGVTGQTDTVKKGEMEVWNDWRDERLARHASLRKR